MSNKYENMSLMEFLLQSEEHRLYVIKVDNHTVTVWIDGNDSYEIPDKYMNRLIGYTYENFIVVKDKNVSCTYVILKSESVELNLEENYNKIINVSKDSEFKDYTIVSLITEDEKSPKEILFKHKNYTAIIKVNDYDIDIVVVTKGTNIGEYIYSITCGNYNITYGPIMNIILNEDLPAWEKLMTGLSELFKKSFK